MRLRLLTAALAAVLAATALAGCRTNVGAAATVNGHTITESDVSDYVTPGGPSSAAVANARAQGQTISPRSEALQYLILEQVFEQTLRHKGNGGVPSPGQLASYHDRAASVFLQTNLTGSRVDRLITQTLGGRGAAHKLTQVLLRVVELEYTIIVRKQLTQSSQLVALIRKAGVRVHVNPRYGTWSWNPQRFGLDTKVVTPGYLTVQPSAAAAG